MHDDITLLFRKGKGRCLPPWFTLAKVLTKSHKHTLSLFCGQMTMVNVRFRLRSSDTYFFTTKILSKASFELTSGMKRKKTWLFLQKLENIGSYNVIYTTLSQEKEDGGISVSKNSWFHRFFLSFALKSSWRHTNKRLLRNKSHMFHSVGLFLLRVQSRFSH